MSDAAPIEAEEVFGKRVKPRLSVFAEERRKLRITIVLFALLLLGLIVFLIYSVNQGLNQYWRQRETELASSFVDLLKESLEQSTPKIIPADSFEFRASFVEIGTKLVGKLEGVTLYLVLNGKIIASTESTRIKNDSAEQILIRQTLGHNLPGLEVLYSKRALEHHLSTKVVYSLIGLIVVVSLGGLFGIYTLAMNQLTLAEDRSNLASAISHELKTPLTSIKMYLEMLSSGWTESKEQTTQYYKQMLVDTERLARLVNNALQYTSLEQAISSLELKSIPLNDVIQDVVASIQPKVELENFKLEVKIDQAIEHSKITLLANLEAFNQIFINFAENSLKFAAQAEKREIWFGVRGEGQTPNSRLIIYLRDFGPGITKGQEQRIFELFYRGEPELTRKSPGTGIGLALVAGLAERMGAKVEGVNLEVGAEFRLIFNEL